MLSKAEARRRVIHSEGTLDVITSVEKKIEKAADEGKYKCEIKIPSGFMKRVQQIVTEAGFNIELIDKETRLVMISWEI